MSINGELLLTRHGQARCNVTGLVGGPRTCTGLTDTGRNQVGALAARLREEHAAQPISAVYGGPRLRLLESGQIIAGTLGIPLTTEAGLDGPRHGDADGRPWTEIKAAFGGAPDTRPDQPWAAGSETWNAYLQRAASFLRILLARHHGERIVLAAHGETVIAAHVLLLRLPHAPAVGFVTDHGSLTRWQRHRNRLGDERWMLAAHNDTSHLARSA
jgi:2,3-bisphosphoglycerate-dependent phosphoglycerate mutase